MDKKHWYEHVPKSAETGQGGNVTILWDQPVQTDRTIPNNKPDIIIRDNEKRTCMLIDVAISGDRNLINSLNAELNPICYLPALLGAHHFLHVSRIRVKKKEAEKILKYKDLTIEIQRMWNVKNKGDSSNNRRDWDNFKVI